MKNNSDQIDEELKKQYRFKDTIIIELEALCWDLISGEVKGSKDCLDKIKEAISNAEKELE